MNPQLTQISWRGGVHPCASYVRRDKVTSLHLPRPAAALSLLWKPGMTLNESALLDARTAAAKLGISLKTLYTLRKTGQLKTVQITARRIGFDPQDISRFVDSRKTLASAV
jgi:predicted DNA-binding transcriptional regulator AlpA